MQSKLVNSKMELKIIHEKENPLFKRNEIIAEINSETTPKIIEIDKKLSERFSKPVENIKTQKIEGRFGSKTFKIKANIYESMEDKEKSEIKTKKQREAEKKTRMERMKKNVIEENKSEEVNE